MQKLKVLQIIESTGKSGPRYLLRNLVHNLDKDRFQVEVLCSALRDKDFYKDIQKMRDAGVNVIILQMKRTISPLSDFSAFLKLCFYIMKGRYGIVHTHSSKAGFDVRLIIAGEGQLRKDLAALSDKLGMDSRVKLLGFREDIPELLSLMDIFVFPSLWEGMSLALLEAMACGLPVISTGVHGAIDLLGGKKRGILVQKKTLEL